MKKTCKTCVFAKNGNFCPILQMTINAESDSCPRYQETLPTCPICGQMILKNCGTYSNELGFLICDNCGQYLYTCATCKHYKKAPKCVINQYRGSKPIFIEVSKRMGFVTMTGTHLNPEVLDEVCPTCICGSPFNYQKNHKCDNWECVTR